MESAITFFDDSLNPAVRGFLHSPENPNGDALIYDARIPNFHRE